MSCLSESENCPACNFLWKDKEIPGRPGEFYSKIIGISDLRKDRITRWLCPSCDTLFDRGTGVQLGKRGKIRFD